jgi:hypothetical protein
MPVKLQPVVNNVDAQLKLHGAPDASPEPPLMAGNPLTPALLAFATWLSRGISRTDG